MRGREPSRSRMDRIQLCGEMSPVVKELPPMTRSRGSPAFSARVSGVEHPAYLCARPRLARVSRLPGVSGSSGMKFGCRVGSPQTIQRRTPG